MESTTRHQDPVTNGMGDAMEPANSNSSEKEEEIKMEPVDSQIYATTNDELEDHNEPVITSVSDTRYKKDPEERITFDSERQIMLHSVLCFLREIGLERTEQFLLEEISKYANEICHTLEKKEMLDTLPPLATQRANIHMVF